MFSHTSPSFFLNLEWKNRLVPNPRVKCSVSSEVSSMDSHKLRNFFRMSFDTLCESLYGSHTLSEVCVICFRLVLAERIWTFCLSSAVVSLCLRLYLLNFSSILERLFLKCDSPFQQDLRFPNGFHYYSSLVPLITLAWTSYQQVVVFELFYLSVQYRVLLFLLNVSLTGSMPIFTFLRNPWRFLRLGLYTCDQTNLLLRIILLQSLPLILFVKLHCFNQQCKDIYLIS